ncbi:hypothetical protein ACIRPK_17130 [Kitasatospora sp. NPDC101801]|uniref:hypothetical protein n=1 Tax=Kitasatospora sp. NPDC101801 TaxID=3364103 RepID=UPI00380B0D8A
MTHSHLPAPGLLGRLPLDVLYPAAYRAAHGAEITAVFAEAVEHTDRRTALREWSALAAHAVRLRTKLSSRDPAGRIIAGAAPFLLAGGAAVSLVHLLLDLFLSDSWELGSPAVRIAVGAAQTAPWVLALLCAALGRWTPARALVLVAVVARIVGAVVAQAAPGAGLDRGSSLPVLWSVIGVLVLVAPPDAVDLTRQDRSRTTAAALAVALPMSGAAALWLNAWPYDDSFYRHVSFPPSYQALFDVATAWPAFVIGLAYLGLLAAPDTDPLRAAGIALAALPWTLLVAPPQYGIGPADVHNLFRTGIVLAVLAAATTLGLLLRTRRHTGRTEPDAASVA